MTFNVTKAMILSAGRGARLRPLTDHLPKPLIDLGGETLIARHLRRLREAGIREVVVNLHHLGAMLEQAIAALDLDGITIRFSREAELMDIAGGIRAALHWLDDGPFLLQSADVWTDMPLAPLLRELPAGVLGRVALVPSRHAHIFRLLEDGQHVVSDLANGHDYGGSALLRPELFRGLAAGPRPIREVFDAAIENRQLIGWLYEGPWFNIGTAEELRLVRDYTSTLRR